MRVSRLTAAGDWTFGKGRANYARRSDAIKQSIVTRLRSFTEDWFLDTTEGSPWVELMGAKQTQKRILREVETRVLATDGVRSIESLRLVSVDKQRHATIELSVMDIFDTRINITVTP
jgi:hypothetical protein